MRLAKRSQSISKDSRQGDGREDGRHQHGQRRQGVTIHDVDSEISQSNNTRRDRFGLTSTPQLFPNQLWLILFVGYIVSWPSCTSIPAVQSPSHCRLSNGSNASTPHQGLHIRCTVSTL